MIAGIGSVSVECHLRHKLGYNHNVELLKLRFEKLGVDYTRGFIAARYNTWCGMPKWWVKFKEFFRTSEDIIAAKAVLEDAGIDPWSCGDDLFKLGMGIEQD